MDGSVGRKTRRIGTWRSLEVNSRRPELFGARIALLPVNVFGDAATAAGVPATAVSTIADWSRRRLHHAQRPPGPEWRDRPVLERLRLELQVDASASIHAVEDRIAVCVRRADLFPTRILLQLEAVVRDADGHAVVGVRIPSRDERIQGHWLTNLSCEPTGSAAGRISPLPCGSRPSSPGRPRHRNRGERRRIRRPGRSIPASTCKPDKSRRPPTPWPSFQTCFRPCRRS